MANPAFFLPPSLDLGTLAATRRLERFASIAAGALLAFGLLLVVAANWSDWTSMMRFGLLGAVYALAATGAAFVPRFRIPAALVAFAATGGLFALIGMTYQTGADPWTLFAWWAALTLPLAFAVRHDALWTPWVLVAFTALPLWLYEMSPRGWGGPSTVTTLVAWTIAIGITLAMVAPSVFRLPASGGRLQTANPTRWAFRLATLLAVALISTHAAIALTGSMRTPIYLLGVLIIAAALVGLALLRPLDVPALTVTALGLDALLIVGVWRLFIAANVNEVSLLLLTAISVGIVVATMRWLRDHLQRVSHQTGTPMPSLAVPGAALGALGAMLAALPFIAALYALFGGFLNSRPGAFVVGAALTVAGTILTSRRNDFGFAQMSGLMILLAGSTLMVIGIEGTVPVRGIAALLVILSGVLAVLIQTRWIAALLGFGSGLSTALAITWPMTAWVQLGHPAIGVSGLVLAVIGSATWWIVSIEANASRLPLDRALSERAAIFAVGWLAGTFAVTLVAAGPTFLLGAASGLIGGVVAPEPAAWLAPSRLIAIALAAAIIAVMLMARRDSLRLLDIALALAALVLVACIPPLAVPILIGAVAIALDRRAMAVAAAIVGLWCVGAFYYRLDLELMQKGLLLAALGAGLGAISFATTTPREKMIAAPRSALVANLASCLVAISALTTGGSVAYSIRDNEAVLRAGRLVHIALAPIDPRSLTQGDYMALRFALPDVPRTIASDWRLQAVGDVDDKGVATLRRIEATPASHAPTDVVVDLTYKRDWMVATDAFFFREGRAKAFEAAKFGTFRIAPDGRARLVGLADENLIPLR